ncbi:hypothetical protein Btru_068195 [Bulinus truncatus]|nr:hypothetical protein Btru_068195 [Bulinus truncatus]
MATSIKDVGLSSKRLQEILDVSNDWSLSHGISIIAQDEGEVIERDCKKAVSAPYSLFPSVVPAKILQQAKLLMCHFNMLMHKVALDHSFLEKSLKNVIEADDFMKHLWEIYLKLPDNKPATGFAEGLAKAWELYGNKNTVILYIVSSNERNVIDQRWLEFKIYNTHPHIPVLRRTFLDVHNNGVLDGGNVLKIDGEEVAVVYLRDGYTAENYSSEKEWNGRLKLELSTAIKCPSIQYQLMGSKKIQQELARPGALERFISDSRIIQDLRRTFADLYSLDLGQEGDEAVEKALAAPEKFVLKPQREGGGHNLYSEAITQFFNQHRNSKEREGYILMQRIFPWQQKNYLVKRGVQFLLSDVVSELGIYGVYIGFVQQSQDEL